MKINTWRLFGIIGLVFMFVTIVTFAAGAAKGTESSQGTLLNPEESPTEPSEPCTWDGKTVEENRPGWWEQEQARYRAILEAEIFSRQEDMTIEEAALQDWAPRVGVGPDVTALDLPEWMQSIVVPIDCTLIVDSGTAPTPEPTIEPNPTPEPTPEPTPAPTLTPDEVLQETWFSRRTTEELAAWAATQESQDRAWLASEISARGAEPFIQTLICTTRDIYNDEDGTVVGERESCVEQYNWQWSPCWPPEAMPWYPADFPSPARWMGVRSGCR